jgi:DNA polymerase IV
MNINTAEPRIMHIDLNSCFAIVEQQANRLLRGRPVGISAYDTPRGFVLASSYEAKRRGVKLGVNNQQAKELCPDIVILTPDPSKYREAHKRFRAVLENYTDKVVAKSIDEFVLDLNGSPVLRAGLTMKEIGMQIKQDIRASLGDWITVNIGIGPNRFLAKYAAGFNKPDGLTQIDHTNLIEKYEGMQLIDLPGINTRYAARLMACGIYTPIDFFYADMLLLKKTVFKSVVGYYWWARLRGHEVDDRVFEMKTIGHQYALPKKTTDKTELTRIAMKLCEKTGRRLRRKNRCARGIHLYIGFSGEPDKSVEHVGFAEMPYLRSWHQGHRLGHRLYATSDIYEAARYLLQLAVIPSPVRIMAVTVYDLEPWDPEQISIFDVAEQTASPHLFGTKKPIIMHGYRSQETKRRLSDALDMINDRYGEFVVTPGTMMDMRGEILDRIAFGNTPDLE